MIRLSLLALGLVACKYDPPSISPGDDDGGVDMEIPDAGPCQQAEIDQPVCAGDILRTCKTIGELPNETPCGWGCDPTGTDHCKTINPSGGAAMSSELDPMTLQALGDVIPDADISIDTDAGTIAGATADTDFAYRQTATAGVFRVKTLHITNDIKVTGARALVIIADGEITIDKLIDLHGCTGTTGAGPGGHAGGAAGASATGNGAGSTSGNSKGGGGGGYGAIGGAGGNLGGAAGAQFGVPELTTLEGGGGGAGAKGGGGGAGGGGGGAIQLISNTRIVINTTGAIDAGGCGGEQGDGGGNDGGGGGGAGGAILLEAPAITIDGKLDVNGGGGGGSRNTNGGSAGNGGPGTLDRLGGTAGTAGANGGTGAAGGTGGAAANVAGAPGKGDGTSLGAGGGGAAGRIRFNTLATTTLTIGVPDNLSPKIEDTTTCTAGLAAVQ